MTNFPPPPCAKKVIRFVAYVDEAGDEGFGKLPDGNTAQSRWLSLGAAIVSEANDRYVPAWRDEIMSAFVSKKNQRDLHFRDLNHDQKVHACATIATKPVGACVVSSNKITILAAEELEVFKRPQHLYNYLTRLLLERITHTCRRRAETEGALASLKVVFSRRKGTDYGKMREYLEFLRDGREKMKPIRSIDWSVLDPASIAVENHSVRAGLQIADLFTSAVWKAFEPNVYGRCENRYAKELSSRFIKIRGNALNLGLTIVPAISKCPLTTEQKDFIEWVMNKKRKGVGP